MELSSYQQGILSLIGINVLLAFSVFMPLRTGQISLGNAGFMAVGAYAASVLQPRDIGEARPIVDDAELQQVIDDFRCDANRPALFARSDRVLHRILDERLQQQTR